MPMSDTELATIRDWVGSTPADNDVEEFYDELGGNVSAVVDRILKRRLADMQAQPTSFSISGEYSQSTDGNLKSLQAQISDAQSTIPGGPGEINVTKMVRRRGR